MATDTSVHEDIHGHDVDHDGDSWSGGKEPFKASYGKLMMWYFLLSDAFTFAGFLIAYGTLRFSSPTWPVPDSVFSTAPFGVEGAPLIFVTIMSFLLIISSVTMVRAVQEGHRENKNGVVFWMFLTIIGGGAFLGCQAWEWTNLIKTEGMTVNVNPFSSHTEEGTYLKFDEIARYAGPMGLVKKTNNFVDGHGHSKEITYFEDPVTEQKFFEKRDHHGKLPEKAQFSDKTPYLIGYGDVTVDGKTESIYKSGAYLGKDEDGNTVMKSEKLGPKAFGALFFFITGFHGFHVFSGVLFLLIIMINVASGLYMARKNGHEMVEKIGLYWHFVDLVWVFVFLAFYLL